MLTFKCKYTDFKCNGFTVTKFVVQTKPEVTQNIHILKCFCEHFSKICLSKANRNTPGLSVTLTPKPSPVQQTSFQCNVILM